MPFHLLDVGKQLLCACTLHCNPRFNVVKEQFTKKMSHLLPKSQARFLILDISGFTGEQHRFVLLNKLKKLEVNTKQTKTHIKNGSI